MKASMNRKGVAAAATLIVAFSAAGCAQLGQVADIFGGALPGQGGEVLAEVQEVDDREREIRIRTDDGRTADVRYDGDTRVVYQNREYPVTALERGDLVRMRIEETTTGALYTDLVEVEQSAQERQQGGGFPAGSSVERMEGSVSWIDYDTDQFLLDSRDNGDVMVNLPPNPPSDMVRDFRNLDRNDYVRVEVEWLNQQQVQLVAFDWR